MNDKFARNFTRFSSRVIVTGREGLTRLHFNTLVFHNLQLTELEFNPRAFNLGPINVLANVDSNLKL